MSAGEIRLCYIPSFMSSVLIISRHNTSCSSRFPAQRTDFWGRWYLKSEEEAGVHHLKMQMCSCHDVLFVMVLQCAIWFMLDCVDWRKSEQVYTDALCSFKGVWINQFMVCNTQLYYTILHEVKWLPIADCVEVIRPLHTLVP